VARVALARRRRRRPIDGRLVALLVMGAGLAWILAVAGTSFAFRTMLLLVTAAALVGRPRRIFPARAP
jgi:hypothetical protein